MPGSWSDFLKLRSGPAPPPSSEAGAVRVYADANGALRSVQSDGTDAPIGGGGGSTPVYEAGYYSGSQISVADGGSTILPWDILDSGTAMFDLTTPTHPLVLKAGLFIVCAQVSPAADLSPGGSIDADLILDYGNDNAENANSGLPASPSTTSAVVMASYVLAAGAQIRLSAHNNDGAMAQYLNIKNATVARIGPA